SLPIPSFSFPHTSPSALYTLSLHDALPICFYPLSDGPSMRNHRITKPDFRPCSTCRSRSQAPFCLCTLRMISNHSEGTFGRLRYLLGGDRPSQTARLTLSPDRITALG